MNLFWYSLIAVIIVFGVGILAGLLLAAMHHEEMERKEEEELLPIEIGEVVDDAKQ